jgi:hypothetical protein
MKLIATPEFLGTLKDNNIKVDSIKDVERINYFAVEKLKKTPQETQISYVQINEHKVKNGKWAGNRKRVSLQAAINFFIRNCDAQYINNKTESKKIVKRLIDMHPNDTSIIKAYEDSGMFKVESLKTGKSLTDVYSIVDTLLYNMDKQPKSPTEPEVLIGKQSNQFRQQQKK